MQLVSMEMRLSSFKKRTQKYHKNIMKVVHMNALLYVVTHRFEIVPLQWLLTAVT